MKHARTDANYAISTKQVQLQHEKKPLSNLISMQSAGFEQTFVKFFSRKKNHSGNYLSGYQ